MLIKTYTAGGAVARYRLAKFAAEAGKVLASTAPTDETVGVTTDIAAVEGERVDLVHHGEALVTAGGAIGQGKFFVAGAGGKAVQGEPGAGVRAIGMALEPASADGDIFRAFIFPAVLAAS
ncbi:hypothetical protein ACNQFN_11500 [Thauera butanivorans]|uniref:hypothetical protein n=1 Tax=Thauera butanivorans TaxID=86174 RepID=UPI003AB402E6